MTDRFVIRVVALSLGALVVGALVAAAVLAGMEKDLPELIDRMAMTALGALAALLASTRASDVVTPVTVVNEARDPVPVEAAPVAAVKKAAKKR